MNNQTLIGKSKTSLNKNADYSHLFKGDSNDFSWLLEHMIPIDDEIYGCKIKIPDMVLFSRSKSTSDHKYNFIGIKSDKDGYIVANHTYFAKMTFHQIRLHLTTVHKSKIKDNYMKSNTNYRSFKTEEMKNDNSSVPGQYKPQEKQSNYRDVAIMRFWERPPKVMSENEFTLTFLRRQNDPLWKEVMFVQTNIKAK